MKILNINVNHLICMILSITLQFCNKGNNSQSEKNEADSTVTQSSIFSIQIAALRDKNNAESLTASLHKSELPSYILADTTSLGDSLFKVRIGPYLTEKKAEQSLVNVRKLGYEEAFVTEELFEEPIDLDTEEKQDKKQLTFSGDCSHPKWSPGGREIIFLKKARTGEGIYAIGTGGGQISQIVESDQKRRITSNFAWSPSGRKIAFTAFEVNQNWEQLEELFLVNKNGSGLQRLTNQTGIPYKTSDLTFSPDGLHIAFNATYGRENSWSDAFQVVKLVNLEKQVSLKNVRSDNVTELSSMERINSVLGWGSNDDLLFLAAYDDIDQLGYEVWRYRLSTNQRKKVLGGAVVPEFGKIALVNENLLIYIAKRSDKILTLDLSSGEENLILESQVKDASGISSLNVSTENEIYFLSNYSLMRIDTNGRIAMGAFEINAKTFTLSPSARKICFEEGGNLFILRASF